jgi:hypothetical protein
MVLILRQTLHGQMPVSRLSTMELVLVQSQLTALAQSTVYHFRVYEYCDAGRVYNTNYRYWESK